MTDKETDQSTGQETEKKDEKAQQSAGSTKQQEQTDDGSLNDKEMAILLLRMEEQLSQLYQEAVDETYSSKLELLLSGFLQNSGSNRRNLRDLITRHGWFKPSAAKREDYDKVIQKFEGSAKSSS